MIAPSARHLGWLVALLVLARGQPLFACATCGCGDPTLTALGTEKPFRNRIRASLDFRYRTDAIGQAGVDRIGIAEARADTQLAWAPTDRIFLLGTAPLLRRTVSYVNGGETTALAFGDMELRAKVFLAQDRAYAPRRLFAITGGVKLPTGVREKDSSGEDLPMEAQPGTGSLDPILAMSYAYFPRPWSFFASAQGSIAARGTSEFRSSSSLRGTVSIQRQLVPELAARFGVDTRLDSRSFEDGSPERDSGGFIGFLSPQLLVSPTADLLVVLSARVPALEALAGHHREGTVWGIAIAYDL